MCIRDSTSDSARQPLRRGRKSLPEPCGFLGQLTHVACSPLSVLGPVSVPIRSVRAARTRSFATPDPLLTQADVHLRTQGDSAYRFEPCPGENDEPLEFMRIEFPDCVEQVPVDSHLS